jgi:AP-2 complex subunit alpha
MLCLGGCRHRQSIINSLQDPDISIRRRSLDLLFAMCTPANVREIVAELLTYLQVQIHAFPVPLL